MDSDVKFLKEKFGSKKKSKFVFLNRFDNSFVELCYLQQLS